MEPTGRSLGDVQCILSAATAVSIKVDQRTGLLQICWWCGGQRWRGWREWATNREWWWWWWWWLWCLSSGASDEWKHCLHLAYNTSLFILQPSAGLKEKQSHTNKNSHSKLHYWKLVKENGIKEFWKRVVCVRTDGYGFADRNRSVNCESRLAGSK